MDARKMRVKIVQLSSDGFAGDRVAGGGAARDDRGERIFGRIDEQWVSAITRFAGDAELRKTMGAASRAWQSDRIRFARFSMCGRNARPDSAGCDGSIDLHQSIDVGIPAQISARA